MKRASACAVCAIALLLAASPGVAHWYPGDGENMHYPQLPDPSGWDVEYVGQRLADDWQAEAAYPISEIHFWTSWYSDLFGYYDPIYVEIWADGGGGPVAPLWGQTFTVYEEINPYGWGNQGFYDPFVGSHEHNNHMRYQQVSVCVTEDLFVPVVGETYWLVIWVWWDGPQASGWKSSLDEWGTGAYYQNHINHEWYPIAYPDGRRMDLAFVVGPAPSPVEPRTWGRIKAMFASVSLSSGSSTPAATWCGH